MVFHAFFVTSQQIFPYLPNNEEVSLHLLFFAPRCMSQRMQRKQKEIPYRSVTMQSRHLARPNESRDAPRGQLR